MVSVDYSVKTKKRNNTELNFNAAEDNDKQVYNVNADKLV